jgi:hypothetical protein
MNKLNSKSWLTIFGIPILAIPLTLYLLSGCEVKPSSIGMDNELAILIDEGLRTSVEYPLLDVFCPLIFTPQPERRFVPVMGGIERIDALRQYQFILLVGTLDGSGEISELIRNMLTPEVTAGVQEGRYYVFGKKDEWARNQAMLIIVAPDAVALVEKLEDESENLFSILNKEREQRVKAKLFRSHEQKDLAEDIAERYEFHLRIPHDYVLVREEFDGGWLRLKRMAPDRWLTLWRSLPLGEDPVDTNWAVSIWSDLASRYADPLRYNPDYLTFEQVEVAGYPGLEMRGLWEAEGPLGGGPFFCWMFFNPLDERTYLIEGEAYNPGDVKEPYIKQLEVIASTFYIPGETTNY